MKRLLVTGAVVATLLVGVGMTSSCITRGRPTNNWVEASPQLAELISKQEIGVWEALKKKDKLADRNLLAEDFIGVYKDGFGNRAEHIAQIDDKYQLTEYKLENVRVLMISADSAMIVYRATCSATGTWASDCAQPMYISSLWIRQDSNWVNVFSQDTYAVKKDPQ